MWWSKKYGRDKVCSISTKRLRQGKTIDGRSKIVYLPCGHGFYRKELLIWTELNPTCPLCRQNIDVRKDLY